MTPSRRKKGECRNPVEQKVGEFLAQLGLPFSYETDILPYVLHKRYTPDFTVKAGGSYLYDYHLEVKGWWPSEERAKTLAVVHGNPMARLLVALQKPNTLISKTSKTTYSMWCEKHGIRWCPIPIPVEALHQWLGLSTFPAPPLPARVRMGLRLTLTDQSTATSAKDDSTLTEPTG